jgi:hypothetical protein
MPNIKPQFEIKKSLEKEINKANKGMKLPKFAKIKNKLKSIK